MATKTATNASTPSQSHQSERARSAGRVETAVAAAAAGSVNAIGGSATALRWTRSPLRARMVILRLQDGCNARDDRAASLAGATALDPSSITATGRFGGVF